MSTGKNCIEGVEMIYQLRIYEIFEHNKAAFHDRFRDHAARIMKSYGFDIIATWESKTSDRTEFVYLLAWPDEQTMLRARGQFRADEEWRSEEHTSELQSHLNLVCRLLLEKKKKHTNPHNYPNTRPLP